MPEGVGYGPQNTASTGLSLNIIGNHAYAYAENFQASTSSTTALSFTTGAEYIVGKFNLNAAIQVDTANITGTFFRIKLNGEQVGISSSGDGSNDSPTTVSMDMILAPYTVVLVEVWADGNASSSLGGVQFTGRIYK